MPGSGADTSGIGGNAIMLVESKDSPSSKKVGSDAGYLASTPSIGTKPGNSGMPEPPSSSPKQVMRKTP